MSIRPGPIRGGSTTGHKRLSAGPERQVIVTNRPVLTLAQAMPAIGWECAKQDIENIQDVTIKVEYEYERRYGRIPAGEVIDIGVGPGKTDTFLMARARIICDNCDALSTSGWSDPSAPNVKDVPSYCSLDCAEKVTDRRRDREDLSCIRR